MITSGDSVMQHDLFQQVDGGANPTSPLQYRIKVCKFSDIRSIFERFHYKGGHMGGGISICYCLVIGTKIVAGSVIGKLRHDKKYSSIQRSI